MNTLLSLQRSGSPFILVIFMVALPLHGCGGDQNRPSPSKQAEEHYNSQPDDPTAVGLPPEEYTLTVQGQVVGEDRIQVNVQTNIPGVIDVMAGVSLADQAPDDIFVGKTERMTVRVGSAQTAFDVSDLPQGEYDVEATFYPRWGFQDERSRATGITEEIESKHSLTLEGSGESVASVSERNEGQRWVMENVSTGMAWNPVEWRDRFGNWEEFAATTRNPDVITNYYFDSIDMTLVVNTFKNEIVTWKMGRDGL